MRLRYSLARGRWTVVGLDGAAVGAAAATGFRRDAYAFSRAGGGCLGGVVLAASTVNRALPPDMRLSVCDALAQRKDVLAALRKCDYDARPSLVSRPARWDGEGYVLDFPADLRVRASAKNFQMGTPGDDGVLLQLARVDKDTYVLEFAAPLSPFVAYAAALTHLRAYALFQ